MTYILALNGPPRSGKDTIADEICSSWRVQIPTMKDALSLPMRSVMFALMGRVYDRDTYERIKGIPLGEFGGLTGRDVMIKISEEWVKPDFGKSFWASNLIARNNILRSHAPGLVVISDAGFKEENEILKAWVGEKNYMLIHLMREGHSFAGDSRNYVDLSGAIPVINEENRQQDTVNFIFNQMIHKNWQLT